MSLKAYICYVIHYTVPWEPNFTWFYSLALWYQHRCIEKMTDFDWILNAWYVRQSKMRETNRSNPGQDAPNSYANLYGREFPECAEGAYSIVSLHRTSRTLLCSDTIFTVVATITFVVAGYASEPDNLQRFDDFEISRLFADFIVSRLFVSRRIH